MQLTPNYNLKKPEETDPIDILDLNDNADIIDAEFKKRPVASGGDVSEMTVKTLETTTTEFPVPVAGESTKTFLGKVKKFFEDTKNWMTGVCLIGQIVNNCVTNNAKLPLSAAQGKVLMDLYTVLNTKNDNYGKILWTGSSFFATPENVPDCSNYKVLIFYNSIGAYSVWRDSILTFTYLANSSLYIDTFSVLRNGNTIKLTNNTRYCAGTISTSDIPITKIMGVV